MRHCLSCKTGIAIETKFATNETQQSKGQALFKGSRDSVPVEETGPC